ncbi:hypothetical protein ACFXDI_44525 [Streptomyces mirabilis]|uniref:hypothetical protein n=1 Tax=Streptomyces mirabilis TaxID=68239 RepID=UPI0036829463
MTALQDLKYGQWFRGADIGGDGFITQRDVRMMSERYLAARGTAPDSRRTPRPAACSPRGWTGSGRT